MILGKSNNHKTSSRGFTLVELLVVISIIGILSLVVISNHKLFRTHLSLQRTATKLSQDIRRTEEMAMAAKKSSNCSGKVPSGGYGIYFNQSTQEIKIFADCDNNQQFTSESERIETVKLEPDVKISSLSCSPLNIVFGPPTPNVSISGGGNITTITLSLKNEPSRIKNVVVEKSGLIYIK